MSLKNVASIVLGFFAFVFGLQWLRRRRDPGDGVAKEARKQAQQAKKQAAALRRLRHQQIDRDTADAVRALTPADVDELSTGDFVEWFNDTGRRPGAGPAPDTDDTEPGD